MGWGCGMCGVGVGGEDDGRGEGGGGGREEEGDARALESWREPWVGNDPESSRSTTPGAPIWKQNAEQVVIWNTEREREGERSSCPAAVD